MAVLYSIQGEVQLSLRLLGKSFDPFQKNLEWFEYEMVVEAAPLAENDGGRHRIERRSITGRMNRQEFNELLRGIDGLIVDSDPMRFEPFDLKFYFEWSHETPLIYLIVAWFDLALAPRTLEQRFPTAHAGFRFLTDKQSLQPFRHKLEEEFVGKSGAPKSATFIN